MERVDFNPLMDKFSRFYKTKLDELQTDWWFETFKDVPAKDFLCALNWHIAHDQYNCLPAPGKINAALEALDEEDRHKKQEYPEFSQMWIDIVQHFPKQHNYDHFPPPYPEGDIAPWKDLYDKVARKPYTHRREAATQAMVDLEKKYGAVSK
jgi:hypothetical protein